MTPDELEKKLLVATIEGKFYGNFFIQHYEPIYKREPDRFRPYFLNNPTSAYYFAYHIDKMPRNDTRKAVCKSSYWAFMYAKFIDKAPHKETWEAVLDSTSPSESSNYIRHFGVEAMETLK